MASNDRIGRDGNLYQLKDRETPLWLFKFSGGASHPKQVIALRSSPQQAIALRKRLNSCHSLPHVYDLVV